MTSVRPERIADLDQLESPQIETEVRDFVRRDFSFSRRRHPDTAVEAGVENIHSLIHRVGGVSIGEIERVIGELQAMRDMLRDAGDRAQREITAYADISQAAMASVAAIAEDLTRWRTATTSQNRHDQIQHEAS